MKKEFEILKALRMYYSDDEITLGMVASSEGLKKAELTKYMLTKELPIVYCEEDNTEGLKMVDRILARGAYAELMKDKLSEKQKDALKMLSAIGG
ncbi:MAG: hypothetical protein U9Q22_00580 [Candidatus Altiarchaeota archaeon]|nr:hypothetical protein [Candidatus Altiarchaeota archaeon]